MQFAVLPAIPQMPSSSIETSYNLLQCPLLSKVGVKEGVAKHNPNDLHWFLSPFKCCKKDSTHLTVPHTKIYIYIYTKKQQRTQLRSDQAIDLHRFSDCNENWKHEISCSWKTKKTKKSLELGFSVTNVCTFFLILPFWKVDGLAEMLYRVYVFVWMLWVKRHRNEIMFRDYWFGGFEESTYRSTPAGKRSTEKTQKNWVDIFATEPIDTCTTAKQENHHLEITKSGYNVALFSLSSPWK